MLQGAKLPELSTARPLQASDVAAASSVTHDDFTADEASGGASSVVDDDEGPAAMRAQSAGGESKI